MTGVLVDAKVLIDIAITDSAWGAWSARALECAGDQGPLVINPLIYAEVSVAYPGIEELDKALPEHLFRREDLPWPAAFVAGKAYLSYCRRGGTKISPLPDFYIGAHAAVAGYRLLTRDRGRYETYFPTVGLITPEG